MTTQKPSRHRVSYAELYAFAAQLKANPDGEWQRIPSHSRHPSQIVHRQRTNAIPALPADTFESRQLKGVAVARYRTGEPDHG